MSDKHLTEPPWKALVAKTEVKDTGLQKALQAYAKIDPAKEAAKALEALEVIAGQAIKLKKANPALKEVIAYLDEVVKELNKTRQGLAPLAKAQEAKPAMGAEAKPGAKPELKEEEDLELDVKSLLLGAMKKVKMRQPEDPPMEAMVCKAGAAFAVLLARKVGAAQKAKLQELLKDGTGHKFLPGTCEWEEPDVYTFVLETLPSGAVKGLKAFFKAHTGINYKLKVRDLAGSMEADIEEAEVAAAPAGAGTPPATAKPDPMVAFKKRFEGMLPAIKAALAAGGTAAETIKLKFEEAGAQARNKAFPQAEQSLDALEAMLRNPPAAIKTAAAPKPAVAPPPKPAAISPRLSTYMNATKDWKEAKAAAAKGVLALKNAILSTCDPELENLVKAKVDQFDELLTPMDDAIITKIQEAGNEPDEERQAERNRVLVKFAQTMRDTLQKHPLAAVADQNPFGTFAVCSPVETVLAKFTSTFGG